MVAEVTVFPVPGGPWIRLRGFWRTLLTAKTWDMFSSGRLGADILSLDTRREEYSWGDVPLWHLSFEGLGLGIVAEEFVVQEATHALFVDGKGFHSELHAIK
jgi:hypothetical protein